MVRERTNEAPMDFEWQTRPRGDPTSPFYQISQTKPQQNIFAPPTVPSVAPTASTPSRPLTSAFYTPRRMNAPSSPEQTPSQATDEQTDHTDATDVTDCEQDHGQTDTEQADTDAGSTSNNGRRIRRTRAPVRRSSIFNFRPWWWPSPSAGRGAITKKSALVAAGPQRQLKRRQPWAPQVPLQHLPPQWPTGRRRRYMESGDEYSYSESASDSDSGRGRRHRRPRHRRRQPSAPQAAAISRLFTFLESHPHIPRILSFYAQFAFNAVLALVVLYVVAAFVLAVRADVARASEEASAAIMAEMAECARSFVENRCAGIGETGRRLPALETVCGGWERCMNRDPAHIGRAKVSAQTLAEVFNSFVEPISFKAMFFFLGATLACMTVSNLTFSFFRNKLAAEGAGAFTPAGPSHHGPPPSPSVSQTGTTPTSFATHYGNFPGLGMGMAMHGMPHAPLGFYGGSERSGSGGTGGAAGTLPLSPGKKKMLL